MEVGYVGLEIHDASDSLSDHIVSSSISLPHFENCSGPCISYIQEVYKTESEKSVDVLQNWGNVNVLNVFMLIQ